MNKRGVYRAGYYLAVLRSLDLHYRVEAAAHCYRVDRYQPLPRNRPDQFLRWITGGLGEAGFALPTRFDALVATLRQHCLPEIARVLDHVVRRRLARSGTARDPSWLAIDEILAALGEPDSHTELHPQVRKIAAYLRTTLDARWLDAVRTVERHQRGEPWPRVSVVLGALPPGFPAVYDQVRRGLQRDDLGPQPGDLDVMRFYGLATGSVPDPPDGWHDLASQLHGLSDDDLAVLRSLSSQQHEQLRRLDHDGFVLVILLRSLRHATPQWRRLITTLRRDAIGRSAGALRSILARWERAYRLEIRQLDRFIDIARTDAWLQVEALDEELVRRIDRGQLSLELYRRIRSWTPQQWRHLQRHFERDGIWLTSWLDDTRFVDQQRLLRRPVRLELRELFPETIGWIDRLVSSHHQSILLRDLDEVKTYAARYAELVLAEVARGEPTPPGGIGPGTAPGPSDPDPRTR